MQFLLYVLKSLKQQISYVVFDFMIINHAFILLLLYIFRNISNKVIDDYESACQILFYEEKMRNANNIREGPTDLCKFTARLYYF